MTIPMKTGYIYLGTTSTGTNLAIPCPTDPSFSRKPNYRSQTAADGSTVIQTVGRSRTTLTISWEIMDSARYTAIGQFLETANYAVWVKFYDHVAGAWKTKQFTVDSYTCQPHRPNTRSSSGSYGKALFEKNVTMVLNDMGG